MNKWNLYFFLLLLSFSRSVSADLPIFQRNQVESKAFDSRRHKYIIEQIVEAHSDNSNFSLQCIREQNIGKFGKLYTYQQMYQNIPVHNATVKIREEKGNIFVSDFTKRISTVIIGDITAIEAVHVVSKDFGKPHNAVIEHPNEFARKKIILQTHEARMVYEVYWPSALPYMNWYFWIDSVSGKIIQKQNLVLQANPQAEVILPYDIDDNKMRTATVTLSRLKDTPEKVLQGEVIDAYSCLEKDLSGKTTTITITITFSKENAQDIDFLKGKESLEVPFCSELQYSTALDDTKNGNYFYKPVILDTEKPQDKSLWPDKFSEVNAYYHANVLYDRIREVLDDQSWTLRQVPFRVTTNFLIPTLSLKTKGGLALGLFNNGLFIPKEFVEDFAKYGIERNFDSVILGQGTYTDIAYDATVVYHEVSHGINETYVKIHETLLDTYGSIRYPFAINEALSDYFSLITSKTSVYGAFLDDWLTQEGRESRGGSFFRDPSNTRICPDNIVGEEHADGKIILGSLWEIRKFAIENGIHENDFDAAVLLSVMSELPDGATFDDAGKAFIRAFEQALGNKISQKAEEVFKKRGVTGCERVVLLQNQKEDLLILESISGHPGFDYMPPPVQHKVSVPSNTQSVEVRITMNEHAAAAVSDFISNPLAFLLGELTDPEIDLLIKKNTRISFSYSEDTVSDDSDNRIPFEFTDYGKTGIAEFSVPNCHGDMYFAMANTAKLSRALKQIEIVYHKAENPKVDCVISDNKEDSGCGCQSRSVPSEFGYSLFIFFGTFIFLLRKSQFYTDMLQK